MIANTDAPTTDQVDQGGNGLSLVLCAGGNNRYQVPQAKSLAIDFAVVVLHGSKGLNGFVRFPTAGRPPRPGSGNTSGRAGVAADAWVRSHAEHPMVRSRYSLTFAVARVRERSV